MTCIFRRYTCGMFCSKSKYSEWLNVHVRFVYQMAYNGLFAFLRVFLVAMLNWRVEFWYLANSVHFLDFDKRFRCARGCCYRRRSSRDCADSVFRCQITRLHIPTACVRLVEVDKSCSLEEILSRLDLSIRWIRLAYPNTYHSAEFDDVFNNQLTSSWIEPGVKRTCLPLISLDCRVILRIVYSSRVVRVIWL